MTRLTFSFVASELFNTAQVVLIRKGSKYEASFNGTILFTAKNLDSVKEQFFAYTTDVRREAVLAEATAMFDEVEPEVTQPEFVFDPLDWCFDFDIEQNASNPDYVSVWSVEGAASDPIEGYLGYTCPVNIIKYVAMTKSGKHLAEIAGKTSESFELFAHMNLYIKNTSADVLDSNEHDCIILYAEESAHNYQRVTLYYYYACEIQPRTEKYWSNWQSMFEAFKQKAKAIAKKEVNDGFNVQDDFWVGATCPINPGTFERSLYAEVVVASDIDPNCFKSQPESTKVNDPAVLIMALGLAVIDRIVSDFAPIVKAVSRRLQKPLTKFSDMYFPLFQLRRKVKGFGY